MSFEIKNLERVTAAIDDIANAKQIKKAMETSVLEVESEAKKLCPKDTGRLKGSIESNVTSDSDSVIGTVSTAVEYAPYVEYGTGLFAVKGDGRKDVPWWYKDAKGDWHKTNGRNPYPFMIPALNNNRNTIINNLKNAYEKEVN